MKTENETAHLLARILSVHMRTADPARYAWVKRPGWFTRIWLWLREDDDWSGRQW